MGPARELRTRLCCNPESNARRLDRMPVFPPLDPQLWAWVKACALNNLRPVF